MSTEPARPPFIQNFSQTDPVDCPCGTARRIASPETSPSISIHSVSVKGRAQLHYHRCLTEHYVILRGEGHIRLGDERRPVRQGDVIMIPPGVRHALEGDFELINVVTPPFDSADEFLAED